jgi:hypothetical protein
MSKKLTVRLNETATYEVRIEMENPTRNAFGGLSLDVDRLKIELKQHGCSEDLIVTALQEIDRHGSTTMSL